MNLCGIETDDLRLGVDVQKLAELLGSNDYEYRRGSRYDFGPLRRDHVSQMIRANCDRHRFAERPTVPFDWVNIRHGRLREIEQWRTVRQVHCANNDYSEEFRSMASLPDDSRHRGWSLEALRVRGSCWQIGEAVDRLSALLGE